MDLRLLLLIVSKVLKEGLSIDLGLLSCVILVLGFFKPLQLQGCLSQEVLQ